MPLYPTEPQRISNSPSALKSETAIGPPPYELPAQELISTTELI